MMGQYHQPWTVGIPRTKNLGHAPPQIRSLYNPSKKNYWFNMLQTYRL